MSEEPKTTVSDYIKALFTMADNMEQPCEQDERQRILVAANELKAAWERERVEIAARAATDAVHLTNEKWMRDCANVAKLREALEVVLNECCHHLCAIPDQLAEGGQTCDWRCVMPGRCEAIDKAKAALAAPARNCDVGTAEEQAHRFFAFCHAHRTFDTACSNYCPFKDAPDINHCQSGWGQLPYEAPAKKGGEA